METRYRLTASPLGTIMLAAQNAALIGAWFIDQRHFSVAAGEWREVAGDALLDEAAQQLAEWFAGRRQQFALPMAPVGTAFQQQVWREIGKLGFGEQRAYGDVARALGKPRALRAVGAATGRNPLSIIVPCHRLVAANGALTGYDGGLARKAALLRFEAGEAGAFAAV